VTEDPFMTIDAYLGHVRENLPDSIGDEVIAELRGYMIEMAEDLSNGTVTSASAKKVVARFGAPSEVAKEYVLSVSDSTESVIGVHRIQQQIAEDIQQQRRDLSPARYGSTFFKFIVVVVLWLAISWTVITPLVYWWATTAVIFAPVMQLGVVASAFAALLLISRIRSLQLRNATYSNWSRLQKLVTFPENVALEVYRTNVLVDVGLTILAVFAFAVLGVSSYGPFLMLFAAPTMLFIVLHLIYAVRRFGNSDPVSFIRREYVVNVVLLLLLNAVIAWGTYPWGWSSVNPFLVWYALGYSTLILYQVVIRTQDLWWEGAKISDDSDTRTEVLSSDAKRMLLDQTKRTALRTIGGIIATFAGIVLAGFAILILANIRIPDSFWYTQWSIILIVASFSAVVSVALASAYFGVRYYLIRSRGRTEVFGNRTKVEAAIDLIITVIGLNIVLWSWPHWAGDMISNALGLIIGAYSLFRLVLVTALSTWAMFLLLALVARIAANLGALRERGSDFAEEAMEFSGNLFVVQSALMTGNFFSLMTYQNYYLPPLIEMFAILMLSYTVLIVVAFQKSTSGTRLKWKNKVDVHTAIG
jgi:hypothetical protein